MNTIIYTVYKIINNINNKIYIGVHKTTNSNFTKSILFEFNNSTDAYLKETEIVNANFIKQPHTYNMMIGGCGQNGQLKPMLGKTHTEKSKKKMSDAQKGNTHMVGRTLSIATKNKMSINRTGNKNSNFKGYCHTPWGLLDSCANQVIPLQTLYRWCKTPDKVINNHTISRSDYIKSLKENPLGKTFRDLGFYFISTESHS